MRIVFFGTGDFSTDILKGLIASNKQVVAVVSQPDKVNGRNNKTTFSTIKKYCVENNIPLYQFAKLNLEGESVLKELNPDIFITASYGQIIKQNILDIPRFGTINVHASLLPKYRGSAPIQWAIINGETKTGITIMRTELGLDTGDIYFSREIDVLEEDTLSSVFKKLATLGIECLDEFFNNFDYYINHHTKQNEAEASYYPMLKKEDYLLNFNQTSKQIFNRVRGLENCYFIYNNCSLNFNKRNKGKCRNDRGFGVYKTWRHSTFCNHRRILRKTRTLGALCTEWIKRHICGRIFNLLCIPWF